MKKERQKQIGIDAVVKVQNFLNECKSRIDKGFIFSITSLAKEWQIDRMISTLAIRNGYFEKGVVKGEYIVGPNFDHTVTGAKKLIEMVRLAKINSSFKNHSAEIAAKAGRDFHNSIISGGDIVPTIKLPKKGDIAAIERYLAGGEPVRTLFTENEKEFEQKLQIACAIASGCYSVEDVSFPGLNDFIVNATEDLYSKLKK